MNGLANSIAQGQAQRDVEMDCHRGPVSKMSGPPETTASLAKEGPPLQARHQRGLQPQAGPSHRQPPLSRTRPLRSDSNRTRWRCRCSPRRRGSGSNNRTPLHQLGGAPASSAVAAASTETSAAKPATSGTVPSTVSIRGAVDARESSAGAVSSDAAAEVATSTGGTAAPVASAARAARAPASAAGSADDSWAWAISQGRLRSYPRRRVSVRRLSPRPRPIPRSPATCTRLAHSRGCARLAHSRSWGGHSN